MFTAEHAIRRYRETRRKITPQRIAVFRALEGNTSHPSAEDLFESVARSVPGISRATVYNTLETLRELGEVREYHFQADFRQFDPNTAPHHHCLCTDCGRVHDVHGGDFGTVRLPAGRLPFRADSFSVTFYGHCDRCGGAKSSRRGRVAAHSHSSHM
ncbi:MAG: transcriptional repressor [Planctomycetes bacterium]|nr:transcriptional repressor [Planctomycetota bacterium]